MHRSLSCENTIGNSKHRNPMLRRIDDTIPGVMTHLETELFANGLPYVCCESIFIVEFG